jgi:hypothetical protein
MKQLSKRHCLKDNVNAEPVTIWLNGEGPQAGLKTPVPDAPEESEPAGPVGAQIVGGTDGRASAANAIPSFPKRAKPVDDVPHPQPRETSPEALASLQAAHKQSLETMLKELDPQAHFVSYAAPNFIAFRQGVFLELSLNPTLNEAAARSRYRLAAMAFDDHSARLIRPVTGLDSARPSTCPARTSLRPVRRPWSFFSRSPPYAAMSLTTARGNS